MKNVLFVLALMVSIPFFSSCSEDAEVAQQEQSKVFEQFNKMIADDIESQTPEEAFNIVELDVPYKEFYVVPQQINELLQVKKNRHQVNLIHLFKDENAQIAGLGVHFYNYDDKTAYYDLFDFKDGNLRSKDGFPMVTNHFQFDDLVFYLSPKYFNGLDIVTYSNTLSAIEPADNQYSDLYLMRTLEMLKTDLGRQALQKVEISDVDGGACDGPCSISQSPSCLRSNGNICRGYGCACICAQEITHEGFVEARVGDPGLLRTTLFAPERYYDFRDKFLKKSELGSEYVRIFYAISAQYAETINTEFLIDLLAVLPEMNLAIDNILDDNYEGVVMKEELFGKLKGLLNQSIENSDNGRYNSVLEEFTEVLSGFTNKNKSQILDMLGMH